uniref:Transmembrane protein n=1 Tax=Syphacia muris TaxID=451379 RepID=A0A0N5AI15_9BILA
MQAKIDISLPTIPLIVCFASGIFLATTEYTYCSVMSIGSVIIYLLYFFTQRMWLSLLMIAFVSLCVPVQVVCTAIFVFKTVLTNEVRICGRLPNCTKRYGDFQEQCRRGTEDEINESVSQEYEIQPILVNNSNGESNVQVVSESNSTNTMILQPLSHSKLPMSQIILIEAEKLPNFITTTTFLNRILEAPPSYSDVIKSVPA